MIDVISFMIILILFAYYIYMFNKEYNDIKRL